MIPQIHPGGGSFAGVMAYLTHDAGTADNSRPKTTARVGFTEVENLVPCSPDRAGRIMAATVRDAEALKRLAAVSSRGRRLQKPVYHFSLSWAPDENPDQPTMLGAALDSLRVLGMRHHQAVVIEHRDREHPHLHVVVNRVSPEDGRAASTSNDARHLSRWSADWELQHGGIRCRGRVGDRENGPKRERRCGPGRRQRSPEERKQWADLYEEQDYEIGQYFHRFVDTPPGFDDLIQTGALKLAEKHALERAELSQKQARDARVKALSALPGGRALFDAHLADLEPAWGRAAHYAPTRQNTDAALVAAESDAPRLERLRVVLSDEAAAARYRKELGKVAGQFKTADLDRALAAGEREREEREEREAALKTATEATQAAAARSHVKLRAAQVRTIYETGETHEAGIAAMERTARALDAAADQQLSAATIIDTWKTNRPGQIAEALEAAARREEERKKAAAAVAAARQQRWNALEAFPGAQDAARVQFDRLDPGRTEKDVSPQCFDQVLDDVEQRILKSLDVRKASRRKGPNFSYEHGRHYDELLEQARTKVLGNAATERATLTLQQHAQVLDKADLLDGIERVVVYAQRLGEELLGGETPPAHDTLRTALRTAAAETGHADPRWKRIAEAAASGPLDYPDPGIDGDRAAIEQKCIEVDRRQALKEANREYQKDLDAWNALGRVKKAITSQPERQEPEDPAPPTSDRLDEYRQQTLIRRIVQKIREVLDYFLNSELIPADQAAARDLTEQPRERKQRQGRFHGH